MQQQKNYIISLFIIVSIGINISGKAIAELWELPIWLDSLGTVLVAYACGPICGAIVGMASNVIYQYAHPLYMIYGITNFFIGIFVGISANKKMLETIYGLFSISFVVAIISVLLSTPLNCLFFEGYTGNKWGDGVIDFLLSKEMNPVLSYVIGEYYTDFVDKLLTLVLLFLLVRLIRYIRNRKKERIAIKMFVIGLFTVSLTYPTIIKAAPIDYDTWLQITYNNTNGFPTGTANDIAQTEEGILWIATYGGLYRYNGKEFQWMKEYDTIRKVNCLYTDTESRLWVGSNTDGISILINNEVVNVINEESGLPSDSIMCIHADSNSNYYIGTNIDLAVVNFSSGLSVVKTIPEIQYARSITSNELGQIATVTNDGTLFLVKELNILAKKQSNDSDEVYTCCKFGKNNMLYVGTNKNHIIKFKLENNTFNEIGSILCEGMEYINSINIAHNDDVIICSKTGAGCFDKKNESFEKMNTDRFNASFSHVIEDYQGNLWFTSRKLGLLKLCATPFTEIYNKLSMESESVNAITKWQGNLYFGTDKGLDIVDENLTQVIKNEFTEMLADVCIYCLMVDDLNNLWICTDSKGAWCITRDGTITIYDSNHNPAYENSYRCVFETKDNSIILAGEKSLIFIEGNETITVIDYSKGINKAVMNILELPDGTLLLGTNGNGIIEMKDKVIVRNYQKKDGLKTKIIMRMIRDPEGAGVYIVGGDSLYFMDNNKKIMRLENFPYYNNYDIIINNEEELFIPSSIGMLVVKRNNLIADRQNYDYILLDYKKGLRDSLTANAWLYFDREKKLLYLAGSTGVTMMNLEDYHTDLRSYRMNIKSVEIDEIERYIRIGDKITIPANAKRFIIKPEVVNYSTTNPNVSYYLEGFETIPQVCQLSDLTNMIYTNLPYGEYIFHLDVLDNKGKISSRNTYQIIKEANIYEHTGFEIYMIFVFIQTIFCISWIIFRTQIQKTLNLQRRELELAQKQLRMSDEAIITIAKTVDAKDINTSKHSMRVSKYSRLLAERLGFSPEDCDEVERAALLHDIGKIGIPDSVLNKPGRLTDEEYELMKSHVTKGAEILKDFTTVAHIVEGAQYHHERYDGRGYVSGLKGEEIPLYGRLICIADAFDAMTSNRVYRKQLDMEYVINEIKKGRGTQFDPLMADVFLELIEDGTINMKQLYELNNEDSKNMVKFETKTV